MLVFRGAVQGRLGGRVGKGGAGGRGKRERQGVGEKGKAR